MFDIIIRSATQRKVRSGLTVSGIALGIFALVVMGAMSENFNQTFENSMSLTSDKIRVFAESGMFGGGLTDDKVPDVKRVPGVKDAYGILLTTFDEDQMGMSGKQIFALPPEKSRIALDPVKLKAGRFLEPGDTYQILVGTSIAGEYDLQIGSKLEIHDKNFTVIGILEYTGSFFDSTAAIPLETAQDIYNLEHSLSTIFAVPEEGIDSDILAKRIELNVKGTSTLSPRELQEQASQSLLIFSVITISSALLAAIIGGLSVMNTMLMSVTERTREFGILRAMGAETKDILLITLGEAALLGIIGGLLGIGIGSAAVYLINLWLAGKGIILFAITQRLLVVALLFATVIGTISGLYPAYRATKMSPMEALRYG
ncbi:MAG: ABC transporter permease [Methanosarcinaceae archaeon]|nr:ABC transporter permease [Methanosarcinaceae archaeon]